MRNYKELYDGEELEFIELRRELYKLEEPEDVKLNAKREKKLTKDWDPEKVLSLGMVAIWANYEEAIA